MIADEIVGERVPVQLQRGLPEPIEVEVEATDQPAADLHRGEVGIPGEGERREIAGRSAVTVDDVRSHTATLNVDTGCKVKKGTPGADR
ncbi:hypothetical protein GCM10009741_17410 [Kribbella lupini]|uniref:Uncharacterized protein n=1 Tax=Kribbella lupini TaxID=291602 RepID=A0ABP4LAX6_9ACTN